MSINLRIREYISSVFILVFSLAMISNTMSYNFELYDMVYYVITGIAAIVSVNECMNHMSKEKTGELAAVAILPAAFMLSSLFNNAAHMQSSNRNIQIFFWILFISLMVLTNYIQRLTDGLTLRRMASILWNYKWLLLVLVIAAASRLPYMNTLQRWDAGEYYTRFIRGIHYFSYSSFTDFLNFFTLCGHPTLAFSMVYMVGEFMYPQQIIGVMLVNLVITLAALWCIYRIILKIFKNSNPMKAAVYTLIISFAPLFYSTFGYFNPDYALAVFFIYALYGYVYERPIITGFSCLLCIQTKETGLVLVAGLVCAIFLEHIIGTRNIRCMLNILKDLKLYYILMALISYWFYTKAIGGLSGWSQTPEEDSAILWDSNGYNCLGIRMSHIVTKLKQQFVLNFNWIMSALIIAGIIYMLARLVIHIIKRIKSAGIQSTVNEAGNTGELKSSLKFTGIIIPFLAFAAFSCLYITAAMARYNVTGDILLYLMALGVLDTFIADRSVTALVISGAGLTAALTAQCFFTVDPLTLTAFSTINNAVTDMVYVGDNTTEIYYGDYLIYNTQYTYIDKALDKALARAGYDGSQSLVLFGDYGGVQLTGNEPLFCYNWDTRLKRRVFYSNSDTVAMRCLEGDILADNMDLQEEAITVFLPYYDTDIKKALKRLNIFYENHEEYMVSTRQGGVHCHVVKNLRFN